VKNQQFILPEISELYDNDCRYDAFISYRHVEPDRKWAKWLHTSLETYRVPTQLVKNMGLPRRLKRVFRDEEELPASTDLSSQIEQALKASRFLIVVCSPRMVESRWVNEEIVQFRRMGRGERILTLLIEGEPKDSFTPSLCEIRRTITDENGLDREQIEQIEQIEPLAADVRPSRQESSSTLKRMAKLRLLACILGCSFDDLRQREHDRQVRRFVVAGCVLASLVIALGGLAGFAFEQKSRAEKQQRLAQQQKSLAETNAETAKRNELLATARSEEARRNLYFGNISLAQMAWDDGDPQRADSELNKCPVDLRHWEWLYLKNHTIRMKPRKLWFYEKGVSHLSASPDGKWIASGEKVSGMVLLQNMQSLSVGRELQGHENTVNLSVFSPDSRHLATSDDGGMIRIWDVGTGAEQLSFKAHEKGLNALVFSPDGVILATADKDKKICFWDPNNGCKTLSIEVPNGQAQDIIFTHDGSRLIAGCGEPASGIYEWDVNSGKLLRSIGQKAVGGCGYTSVDLSPDGQLLVSASNDDDAVRLHDMATGKKLFGFSGSGMPLYSVGFHPDGENIMALGFSRVMRIYDIASRRQTLRESIKLKGRFPRGFFTPNGEGCITYDGYSQFPLLWPLPPVDIVRIPGKKAIFSHSGEYLAVLTSDSYLAVYNAFDWLPCAALTNRTGEITSMDFCADDRIITVGYSDGTVSMWDWSSGKVDQEFQFGVGCVDETSVSPDSNWLATTCESNRCVAVWDMETLEPVHSWSNSVVSPRNPIFSPDGKQFCFSEDEKIRCFNLPSATLAWETFAARSSCSVWSPDGSMVAAVGDETKVLLLLNAQNGTILNTLHGHEGRVTSLEFSADLKRLFSLDLSGVVRVWDLDRGEQILAFSSPDIKKGSMSVSSRGSMLATTAMGVVTVHGAGLKRYIQPQSPVDLLSLVDVLADARIGEWKRNENTIISPASKKYPQLVLPVRIFGDYRLQVRICQHKGVDAFTLCLPVEDRLAKLSIGGSPDQGYISGLWINGLSPVENATSVKGFQLIPNQEYVVTVEVRYSEQAEVQVMVDDKPFVCWEGPLDSLNRELRGGMCEANELAIGNWDNEIVFSEIQLEMLSGGAWLIR